MDLPLFLSSLRSFKRYCPEVVPQLVTLSCPVLCHFVLLARSIAQDILSLCAGLKSPAAGRREARSSSAMLERLHPELVIESWCILAVAWLPPGPLYIATLLSRICPRWTRGSRVLSHLLLQNLVVGCEGFGFRTSRSRTLSRPCWSGSHPGPHGHVSRSDRGILILWLSGFLMNYPRNRLGSALS